jgi:hypothetical protein
LHIRINTQQQILRSCSKRITLYGEEEEDLRKEDLRKEDKKYAIEVPNIPPPIIAISY